MNKFRYFSTYHQVSSGGWKRRLKKSGGFHGLGWKGVEIDSDEFPEDERVIAYSIRDVHRLKLLPMLRQLSHESPNGQSLVADFLDDKDYHILADAIRNRLYYFNVHHNRILHSQPAPQLIQLDYWRSGKGLLIDYMGRHHNWRITNFKKPTQYTIIINGLTHTTNTLSKLAEFLTFWHDHMMPI
jgi:hypothetical protein